MEEQRKSENALVPALRFEGFSDPWEQRKVGDYLVESRERGSSGDVAKKLTVKLWGKGVTEKAEISGSAHTQYYVRHAGQFIYSKLDFLNAAFGVIPDNLDEYESTADLPAFDVSNLDARFLLLKATQRSFYLRYGTIADGSRKAKRIHSEAFLAMPLFVPDYIEQTRIANLFARLDLLIALHQRKHEKLKTVKQSLLEKMFPKEGEDVPEIRFEGFTDPWEQRKVGEILQIAFRAVDLEDDKKYQLVTVKRRNEGIVERARMAGRDILVKSYQEILAGDFVISKRQLVHGGNGLVPPHLSRSIVSNEYLVIEESKDISTEFWALISRTKSMYRQYFLSSFGVDIEKLVFDVQDWKKREITLPKRREQEKLETLFQKLDSLIALHQRERAGV